MRMVSCKDAFCRGILSSYVPEYLSYTGMNLSIYPGMNLGMTSLARSGAQVKGGRLPPEG